MVYFYMTQCTHNSNLHVFTLFNRTYFTKIYNAHSLTCPSLMCYNLEVSSFVFDICEATTIPTTTVLPYRQNKFFFQIPFITTKESLVPFKLRSTKVICRPCLLEELKWDKIFYHVQNILDICQTPSSSIIHLQLNFTYALNFKGCILYPCKTLHFLTLSHQK